MDLLRVEESQPLSDSAIGDGTGVYRQFCESSTIRGPISMPAHTSHSTIRLPEADLPQVTDRVIETAAGSAIGHSARWEGGQYCALITRRGLIGCGAYHVPTMEHFGQAVAIARGTPEKPLCEPEDLFGARIVEASRQAQELGIRPGDTGLEALSKLLAADR